METKKSVVASGWREGETNRRNTEDFQGSGTTLHDAIMVDTCYYKLV